jgi:hypothetical protein
VTPSKNSEGKKSVWHGLLLSVQPRIRLTRSFDQQQPYLPGLRPEGSR